jgi:biopolymer transport protein ExbB
MNFRFSLLLVTLATTATAFAQDQASNPPPSDEFDLLDIVSRGGPMMYPLGLLSIGAVVLICLFFLTIRRNTVVSNRFMHTAEALIDKKDYTGLLNFSKKRSECIARITQRTLGFAAKNTSAAFNELREVAEAEGSRQANAISLRISYLADIGTIAPMVGLLGTVIGMIKSFLQISEGNFEGVRQMKLASGVSEALVTTAGGLVVGIIAMTFYSVFRSRVRNYIAELESASTHILALLSSKVTEQHGGPNAHAAVEAIPDDSENYDLPPSMQPAPDRHED